MKLNPLDTFTALDFETATQNRSSVCQVGLVRVEKGKIVKTFQSLIRPPDNHYYARFTDEIHGIDAEKTKDSPMFAESWPHWKSWIVGQVVVAHNLPFDSSCLRQSLEALGINEPEYQGYCTYRIWGHSLDRCCEDQGIELTNHHDALSDARACAELFLKALKTGLV